MRTRCEGLLTGAVGFAHYDGKLLLLPGLLPGEEAEFSTAIPHKGRLAAKDLVRLTSSDVRITPSCPYSSVCGGCGFDYVGPEASARLKSAIVRENIESRTGCDLSPVIKEPIWAEGEGYRSRCRIHVSLKDRKLGFLSKRSNELVAIDHCPLLTEHRRRGGRRHSWWQGLPPDGLRLLPVEPAPAASSLLHRGG